MSESEKRNPFVPPQADESDLVEATLVNARPRLEDLPSRWLRLAAASFDFLILFVLMIPIASYTDLLFTTANIGDATSEGFVMRMVTSPLVLMLLYVMVNGYPLAKKGQTWGKKICRIKVVLLDGRPADLFRLTCVRFFPFVVMWQFPLISLVCLIDPLYIFTKQKRCLHDLMAITIVVKS